MPTADPKITAKIIPKEDIPEPVQYNVIYVNDEVTTMEFVIESLIEYFDYRVETAEQITIDIHETGSACVAVLPYEIAEQKGVDATTIARDNGYPLTIKINAR